GVDQRARGMARCRMDDQTGRLIHHHQVAVLKQNFQRARFRLRLSPFRLRPIDGNEFAGLGLVGGFDGAAIDQNAPLLKQSLDGSAGNARQPVAQESVQTPARKRAFDRERLEAAHSLDGKASSFGSGGVPGVSSFQETSMRRPTPTQMALSATLKAGKPISSPLRRIM